MKMTKIEYLANFNREALESRGALLSAIKTLKIAKIFERTSSLVFYMSKKLNRGFTLYRKDHEVGKNGCKYYSRCMSIVEYIIMEDLIKSSHEALSTVVDTENYSIYMVDLDVFYAKAKGDEKIEYFLKLINENVEDESEILKAYDKKYNSGLLEPAKIWNEYGRPITSIKYLISKSL